ncbi:MAG: hypothetical protein QM737_01080 [Ferruginibacter sp.]
MRSILLFFMLVVCFSCSSTKNVKAQANELNGAWVPIYQELGGKAMADSLYPQQKLVINDTTYTYTAAPGAVDRGIIKFNGNHMDIYAIEGANKGRHIPVLYKYEDGKLTICYDLADLKYPIEFETKSSPLYFLSVFVRSK